MKHTLKNSRLRILVLGYIVRGPMGGMTWHHLQYFLALHKMGYDVYFLEDSGDTPYCCYDPIRMVTDKNPAYGLNYANAVFEKYGLGDRWAYYDHHQRRWNGPIGATAVNIIKGADILLNLSCSNTLRYRLLQVPVRVLVDTDPVFTQIRNIADPERLRFSKEHNVFFTFGENYGQAGCLIPDDGIPWRPTRQPVVLDAWPLTSGRKDAPFTTVMKWESYPGKYYNGCYHGTKAESFEDYLDIPRKTTSTMELAVSDTHSPKQVLMEKGWQVSYPLHIANDPWKYQEYIQQSKAEFSIAKHGYVVANTGWFSERSTCYMASGRPVVLQDTGFSKWIPNGKGLICFQNPDEAIEGIKSVTENYSEHCKAARKLAEEYFNASEVLAQLIRDSCETYFWRRNKKENIF